MPRYKLLGRLLAIIAAATLGGITAACSGDGSEGNHDLKLSKKQSQAVINTADPVIREFIQQGYTNAKLIGPNVFFLELTCQKPPAGRQCAKGAERGLLRLAHDPRTDNVFQTSYDEGLWLVGPLPTKGTYGCIGGPEGFQGKTVWELGRAVEKAGFAEGRVEVRGVTYDCSIYPLHTSGPKFGHPKKPGHKPSHQPTRQPPAPEPTTVNSAA